MFNLEQYLQDLEELTNIDSGSYCAAGVNKVQKWFYDRFTSLGYQAKRFIPSEGGLGDSYLYTRPGEEDFDLFVICHVDTVFPEGEVAERPYKREGNEVYGPGVADMKGGCLFTWYAVKELVENNEAFGKVAFFFNGEHEIGCPNTRPVMEDIIRRSKRVIAGECTRGNGAYVKQRKGILRYTFTFEGVAAHAGNNPEDGICAITEMARWILALKEMEDFSKGISVNTGMVKGGVSVNAIPDFAELRVDMRVCELEDAKMMEEKVAAMKPFDSRVKVSVKGGTTRPPMKPDAGTDALCAVVEKIGEKYGIEVKWASVGGGSDASFAPALGKPALCGLTPKGKGAHTKNEIVYLDDIQERYFIYRDIIKEFSML